MLFGFNRISGLQPSGCSLNGSRLVREGTGNSPMEQAAPALGRAAPRDLERKQSSSGEALLH